MRSYHRSRDERAKISFFQGELARRFHRRGFFYGGILVSQNGSVLAVKSGCVNADVGTCADPIICFFLVGIKLMITRE